MPKLNTCKGCNITFKTAHLNRIQEFCTKSCQLEYFKRQRKTRCEYCGNTFERWQNSIEQKYCSSKCYGKARIKNNNEHICQFCNNIFFDQKHPNRKFCSKKCFRDAVKSDNPRVKSNRIRPQKITIQCLQCSKEFITLETQPRKFCSNKCSNHYNKPKNPNKKAVFICKECHKEFTDWAYRNPTFCSRICTSRYAARQPKPNLRKPENFITQKCLICNKKYTIHKIFIEKRSSKYCSRECMSIGTSRRMKGEGNPNYIDGSSPQNYGENWWRQRYKANKRDKSTCQHCGVKHNWPTASVDVHHKVPFRLFNNDYKKANRLNNLICLCRKCHHKAEKKFRAKQEIYLL